MAFRLTSPGRIRLSEKDVVRQCTDFLRLRGYWCQRNPVGKYRTVGDTWCEFGPVGIPDYTAIHAVYPAFFLEFKRPGGKLRPSQIDRFAEIQKGYGLAAVVIDGIEGLAVWLKAHEQRALAQALDSAATKN